MTTTPETPKVDLNSAPVLSKLTSTGAADVFASHAHRADTYGSEPYVNHVRRVSALARRASVIAGTGSPVDAEIVGLLHDTVEDTPVTVGGLRASGLAEKNIEAVVVLTKTREVSYVDYVNSVVDVGGVALIVKFADLVDNSHPGRNAILARSDPARAARLRYKYLLALSTLSATVPQPLRPLAGAVEQATRRTYDVLETDLELTPEHVGSLFATTLSARVNGQFPTRHGLVRETARPVYDLAALWMN